MVAPNTYVRVSGVWKKVTNTYVKVGGTWKAVVRSSVKANGVWKLTYNRVVPGSTTYSTAGTYNFTVPDFNTLQVELWGGGGPGATATTTSSTSSSHAAVSHGFASTITSLGLSAAGGQWGRRWREGNGGGAGGVPSGGDINTAGEAGGNGGTYYINGYGGAAPNGGERVNAPTGDAIGINGVQPGGGASGGAYQSAGTVGGGGGGGAYVRKTYARGALTVGSTLSISVGAGGVPSTGTSYIRGGYGATGRIRLSWS